MSCCKATVSVACHYSSFLGHLPVLCVSVGALCSLSLFKDPFGLLFSRSTMLSLSWEKRARLVHRKGRYHKGFVQGVEGVLLACHRAAHSPSRECEV